jgi:hypothetical protein
MFYTYTIYQLCTEAYPHYHFLRRGVTNCKSLTHTHTHTHARAHTHTRTHTHARAPTHTPTHTHTHTHTRTHTHARTHTHTHTMTPQIATVCATLCRSFANQLRSPQMNCVQQNMRTAVQNRQANCSCHACYVAVLQTLEEYHENTAAKIFLPEMETCSEDVPWGLPCDPPSLHCPTSLYTINPAAQTEDTNGHS